jgi:D-glycero-D-manno-heptose 1,7-bisphosphate phosphatase
MRRLGEWAVFLDRDGVINERLPGEYVARWHEFRFCAGTLRAMSVLARLVGRIVVVTNQQGIGKGLMTEGDLAAVHENMLRDIREAGGRVDGVYHCPHLKVENSPLRKPNVGMAFLAKHDFPDIDFQKSFMVGDSASDMEFGRRLGMVNVFIEGKGEPLPPTMADLTLPNLGAFAQWLLDTHLPPQDN